MKLINIDGKDFYFPSKWNDLTREQLIHIGHLVSKNLTKESFNILFLSYLTGIKIHNLKRISDHLVELSEVFKFVHDYNELTKNLIPTLEIDKITLYGPEAGLVNLTFAQFIIYSENVFNEYCKSQNTSVLDYLIACIYTFKQSIFVESHVLEIQKLIEKVPIGQKNAILLTYIGCRNYLVESYKELFKNTKKLENNNTNPLAFIELLDSLNSGDISKNEIIKTSNIYEVFYRLNKMVIDSKKDK